MGLGAASSPPPAPLMLRPPVPQTKGTTSFGKRHNKSHTLCRRCGRRSYHVQKKTCSACGYPAAKTRSCENPPQPNLGPKCPTAAEQAAGCWPVWREPVANCAVARPSHPTAFPSLGLLPRASRGVHRVTAPPRTPLRTRLHDPEQWGSLRLVRFAQTTGPTRPFAARRLARAAAGISRRWLARLRTASVRVRGKPLFYFFHLCSCGVSISGTLQSGTLFSTLVLEVH